MAASETPPGGGEAPIVIRADRAWEGEEDGVLYLQGNFEMSSAEWRVTAEDAEVHGPVQDPIRLVVSGVPARIYFDNGGSAITGQGGRIVYRYREDMIELYDEAALEGEDISMTSSAIIYDLANERLRSSGSDGVEVIVRRERALTRLPPPGACAACLPALPLCCAPAPFGAPSLPDCSSSHRALRSFREVVTGRGGDGKALRCWNCG